MTKKVTFLGTKFLEGYPGTRQRILIGADEISAVSYFKGDYAAGRSVHLKDGKSFGTSENLSEILGRVAAVADKDLLSAIQVIVHDKTPGKYGFPQRRVRTTGEKYPTLEV